MNIEIAQICNIVLATKSALKKRSRIKYKPVYYEKKSTFIFFNNKKGRAILENIIRAEKTVIYHIPFEEDDKKHYYQIALRDSKRFNEQIKNTEILHNKEQVIII